MVDRPSIEARLARLDTELAALEDIRVRDRGAYLEDAAVQRQGERALQLAIQACIDIGAHLVTAQGLGAPEDYGHVFELLSRRAGLDRSLAERLSRAARLRNLLVHAYLEIDPGLIWEALAELEDLRQFAAFARATLDASEP